MGVNVCNILDDASLNPLAELEVVSLRVTLITALCYKIWVTLCSSDHKFALKECTTHWLLDIDVLTLIQSQHHAREVREVGSLHNYRLKLVAHLIEHLAEVGINLCIGMSLDRLLTAL